jgi:hypothetical protein
MLSFVLSPISPPLAGKAMQPNCHREEHGDVAIPWRTGFRSQRDCFGTLHSQ